MRVLLITGGGQCGIFEHGCYLAEAVKAAGVEITVARQIALDPLEAPDPETYDVLHLNYHAALHSRWTPSWVQRVREQALKPVVITYHDTGVPNAQQCLDLYAVADAFIVHEPCEDLPGAYYWRQGVPKRQSAWEYESHQRPLLGTVGFPFPWKSFDMLAEATAEAGWWLLLLAPTATHEQITGWMERNPRLIVDAGFTPREQVVSKLAGCDATAFIYGGCNTGTSGAIRQGLAARKPLLANVEQRQFRDLALADRRELIRWTLPTVDGIVTQLSRLPISERPDPGTVFLAERDSWTKLGEKYAALYRSLANR